MGQFLTTNDQRQTTNRSRQAFTLIELMVVIGIISILIGILIPAARGMQRAAKNATTSQLIASIEAAVNQYQVDQRDWPGMFPDVLDRTTGTWNQIPNSSGAPIPFTAGGSTIYPTRSEELLLCLSGGVNLVRATAAPYAVTEFSYDPANLDTGHPNLGLKNRARMKAFMATTKNRSTGGFVSDTTVPEFVDAYDSPILYVRAIKGQTSTSAYYTYAAGLVNGGPLYDEALRYVPQANILFPATYLESDSLPGQTRQQDRYLLISAGADKKFGTADDITNFGPPKLQ